MNNCLAVCGWIALYHCGHRVPFSPSSCNSLLLYPRLTFTACAKRNHRPFAKSQTFIQSWMSGERGKKKSRIHFFPSSRKIIGTRSYICTYLRLEKRQLYRVGASHASFGNANVMLHQGQERRPYKLPTSAKVETEVKKGVFDPIDLQLGALVVL